MTKRIIAAAAALLIFAGFVSCTAKETEKIETTQAATTAETTAMPTTAAATETTATTTAAPTTAAPTTAKKPPKTTAKRTTTSKAAATTKQITVPKVSTALPLIDYKTRETSYTEELKYGVIKSVAITTYYKTLDDGTELVIKEDVTEHYGRLGYSAAYNELLPAARENRQKFRSEISAVMRIINGYREEGGLAPLALDEQLTEIACARAEEIAWSGKHSHTRPNGKFFSSILTDAGITKGVAGENIGWGYPDAQSVCEAWKASETHYENIMTADFTKTGVGVAADPDKDGKLCWAQLFLNPKN